MAILLAIFLFIIILIIIDTIFTNEFYEMLLFVIVFGSIGFYGCYIIALAILESVK